MPHVICKINLIPDGSEEMGSIGRLADSWLLICLYLLVRQKVFVSATGDLFRKCKVISKWFYLHSHLARCSIKSSSLSFQYNNAYYTKWCVQANLNGSDSFWSTHFKMASLNTRSKWLSFLPQKLRLMPAKPSDQLRQSNLLDLLVTSWQKVPRGEVYRIVVWCVILPSEHSSMYGIISYNSMT